MIIDDWRLRIDEIDRQLLELLNERTRCAIEIARIKKEQNKAVFDAEREKQVILNARNGNGGPMDGEGVQRFFERVMEECRRMERQVSARE